MKLNERGPARIAGIEHEQAPICLSRTRAVLLALVLVAGGFFSGAILFGCALVAQLPTP